MVFAIGALGGSGTRVVAKIIQELDVYIGDDLNGPNDNLLYTRLFKNVEWYKKSTDKDRDRRHQIFEKCMTGKRLSFSEKIELFNATRSNVLYKSLIRYYWHIFIGDRLKSDRQYEHWGWKEPNSHIYIEDIHRFFNNIKYIFVIRHGLDMAYSSNLQQLNNWGFLYNIYIDQNDSKNSIAQKQLDFWIRSNETAIKKGSKIFKENFYTLNHQKLSENPIEEIEKLVSFMNIDVSDEQINKINKLPKVTSTIGRYKNEDISVFSKEQLGKVKSFGFTI